MEIRQGDIFWVDVDAPQASEPGFTRPFVVVQNNPFQSRQDKYRFGLRFDNEYFTRRSSGGNVRLYKAEANLPKPSVVVVSQMLTLDKSKLREKIGTLSKRRIDEIFDGIKLLTEPHEVDEEIE